MSEIKKLIVNADDYGLTRNVSAGIRLAHQHGIVSSTTAMMNMPGVEEDLAISKTETPHLGIGVHLTLTAGKPVLETRQVPSLVGSDGNFHSLNNLAEGIDHVDQDEVYREWQAQIMKMIALGMFPDHLDSHHHTSYRFPSLTPVMMQLAKEYKLPVRKSENPRILLLKQFYGSQVTETVLLRMLAELPGEITEIMTHPGIPDEELAKISSYTQPRQTEIDVLTSANIPRYFKLHNILLTTFKGVGE